MLEWGTYIENGGYISPLSVLGNEHDLTPSPSMAVPLQISFLNTKPVLSKPHTIEESKHSSSSVVKEFPKVLTL